MDSSGSEDETDVEPEEDPTKYWLQLATDWNRNKHSTKVRVQRIIYQPGHKVIVKKGGKRRKPTKKKTKPKPGEVTRWCVPHAVYHAYLPQTCVDELYQGSKPDHVRLPPNCTEWSLVDKTQGLMFFLTQLLPTHKNDLFGTTKSSVYMAYFPGKKRLTKFNVSQHHIFRELAEKVDENQLMLFFEMRWVMIVPFYFVVTFSLVLDQSQTKAKKGGKGKGKGKSEPKAKKAKAVDYSGMFDIVMKKLCRTMKLVQKYKIDPSSAIPPEENPQRVIKSCMFSQPKKKKAKKNQVDDTLFHPYALSKVEKTVLQPLRAGNVQVTQRPFSAKKAQPLRYKDGQVVIDEDDKNDSSDFFSTSEELKPKEETGVMSEMNDQIIPTTAEKPINVE